MIHKNMIGPVGTRVTFVDDQYKPKKHYGVLVEFDRLQGVYKVVDNKGFLWSIYSTYLSPTSVVPIMQLRAMANKERALVLKRTRSDRYEHYGVVVNGKSMLSAGCRHFTTLAAALEHWKTRKRCTWAYRGYPGNAHKSKLAILHRARDKKLNSFSIAFARKLERLRVKGAK